MQKVIIVYADVEYAGRDRNEIHVYEKHLDQLKQLLAQDWKVVSSTPMGGGGDAQGFASIVVLEK